MRMFYDHNGDHQYLQKLLRSVVRFEHGSGFFVSSSGLILTNFHVLEHDLPDERLRETGFCAARRDDELPLPGVYVRKLVEQRVESLTHRTEVFLDSAERRAFLAPFAAEWQDSEWGWTLDPAHRVITLHRYRRLHDVRLVMLPTRSLATLGSDHRQTFYSFDFAFVRVYDDGHPFNTSYRLRGEPGLPSEGQTSICIGFPHSSCRALTPQGVEHLRTVELPVRIKNLQFLTSSAAAKNFRSGTSQSFIERSAADLQFLTTLRRYLDEQVEQPLEQSRSLSPGDQLTSLYREESDDQRFRYYDQRYSNLLREFLAAGRTPIRYTDSVSSAVDVEDDIAFLDIGLQELERFCGAADPYLHGLQVFSGTGHPAHVAGQIIHKLVRARQREYRILDVEWADLVESFEPARQVHRQAWRMHAKRRNAIRDIEIGRLLSATVPYPLSPLHADGHQRIATGRRVPLGRHWSIDVNALCRQKTGDTLPDGVQGVNRDTTVLYAHDCDVVRGFSGAPTLDEAGHVRGLLIGGNVYSRFGEYVNPPESAFGISLTLDAIWGVVAANSTMAWLSEELSDFMPFCHEQK